MPYDPTKPADDSLADAAELRSQFAGLKTLLDAKTDDANLLGVIQANSSGPIAGQVDYLNLSPNDPPTRADLLAVIDKVNELITALRRT